MITVSTKINRPAKVVWKYFTTISNWSKWYGAGIKDVTPTWQQGAKIIWGAGGASTITKFISGKEVCSSSIWLDRTYKVIPQGDLVTIFTVIESDPKGGASFNDGGAANRADLEHCLQKFKEAVEKETSPSSDPGQKMSLISRLFGRKQPAKPNNDVPSTKSFDYKCPHCGADLRGMELILIKKYIEGGVLDLVTNCSSCKLVILKKDIDSVLIKST